MPTDDQPTVEFVYDFVSIPSHLAWSALKPMAAEAGAIILTTPVLCGAIFKAQGNAGPLGIPDKKAWFYRDLQRWARKRGVTATVGTFVPVRSLPLQRGSLVAAARGETVRYMDTVFDGLYVQSRDLGDRDEFAAALAGAGLDAPAYLSGIDDPLIKQALVLNTQRALERRVFGVPTFFVGDELFFGQDRLDFVFDALRGR